MTRRKVEAIKEEISAIKIEDDLKMFIKNEDGVDMVKKEDLTRNYKARKNYRNP